MTMFSLNQSLVYPFFQLSSISVTWFQEFSSVPCFLLNTDGFDKNIFLLTAMWHECLWALHVFWGWSMTVWRDTHEVRFQIPPISFAKKNIPHIVCTCNPIWQTQGCHSSHKVQNKPSITTVPGKVSWGRKCLKKGHSLSTKSLPMTSKSVPWKKREGNKKRDWRLAQEFLILSSC